MKLIRDKIPDIIKSNGDADKFDISVCTSKKEKYGHLLNKLKEETEELLENPNIDEVADVLEVVYAIANVLGYSDNDADMYRDAKRTKNGGFVEGFLLTKK